MDSRTRFYPDFLESSTLVPRIICWHHFKFNFKFLNTFHFKSLSPLRARVSNLVPHYRPWRMLRAMAAPNILLYAKSHSTGSDSVLWTAARNLVLRATAWNWLGFEFDSDTNLILSVSTCMHWSCLQNAGSHLSMCIVAVYLIAFGCVSTIAWPGMTWHACGRVSPCT